MHAQGVLHRDLKPANIMVNAAGQAQLMDFGIAAAGSVDSPERITEGTPAYMAPEQLAREEVSVRSDIYALGLVMYEMLTGKRAFESKTLDELIQGQASIASNVPTDLAGVVQPRLLETILQCLDRDPSRRPGSATAVAGMLQAVLLDTRSTWRRLLQVVLQALTFGMAAAGLLAVAKSGGNAQAGLVLLASGAIAGFIAFQFPLGWTVDYKGHRIRFYNHPIFGERLYIDDALVDRGRVGLNITLRGTIERGAGAGERITAVVKCGYTSLACRIVAESFAPGSPAFDSAPAER